MSDQDYVSQPAMVSACRTAVLVGIGFPRELAELLQEPLVLAMIAEPSNTTFLVTLLRDATFLTAERRNPGLREVLPC